MTMAEKITLVVYRHKERKDIYLVRDWSCCGGSATTDFYKATKDVLEAITSVLFGLKRGERFDSWLDRFLDENGKTKLVAKIKDSKEFEFDGYKGTATKELTLRCADFETVILTERS